MAAVVGDLYHHIDLYVGSSSGDRPPATLRTRDGVVHPMAVPDRDPSDRLLVTNYNMRPTERFVPLAQQTGLIDLLANGPTRIEATGDGPTGDRSRIGVDFGPSGCATSPAGPPTPSSSSPRASPSGISSPGASSSNEPGGVVCDLDGNPLPWPTDVFADMDNMQAAMNARQKFIAANTVAVATTLAAAL